MQALILLLPLLFAIAAVRFVRKDYTRYIALIGSLTSLVLLVFISSGSYTIQLLNLGSYSLQISTNIAGINLMLLGIVLGIAPLVIFYSFGYMNIRSEQRRFYIEILAFEAAMLLFAMSYSFITLFIAWEFLSLTSYMLIGFWYEKESANKAARKAITTVFIGDICILAVIAIILSIAGTVNFNSAFAALQTRPGIDAIVAVLMIIAIFTKSAQFPFSEWLPDAMEGPTPVSAFLHSSTMVKAGIFAFVILLPIFSQVGFNSFIFYIAFITVVLATLNALKEKHVKRIIAYSTVQELGLMMLAISAGAVAAGVYFFFAQSFYKVLLFFSSGAIMEATEKTSIDETSGLKVNKIVYISTLFGILALAGFIPFDGFFASIGIGASFAGNIFIFAILSIIGMFTSIYAFRWMFLNSKKASPATITRYTSMPKSMVYSMVISAILTLIASAGFFYLGTFLFGNVYNGIGVAALNTTDILIESLIAIIGLIIAYIIYKKALRINSTFLSEVMNNGVIVNKAYEYFAAGLYGIAEGAFLFEESLSRLLDSFGIMFIDIAKLIRKASVGDINLYAIMLAVGIIILFVFVYIISGV